MAKEFTLPRCLECSKQQKANCCKTGDLKGEFTIKDIEKIKSLGYRIEDFLIPREYPKKEIEKEEGWWRKCLVEINNKFFRLNIRKKPDNSCIFLVDGKGCVLGENRIYVCKIYPFWVNSKNEVVFENGEKKFCYVARKLSSVKEVLNLINENEESIRGYFSEIKEDCIKNKEKHRKIILELMKNIKFYETHKNQ